MTEQQRKEALDVMSRKISGMYPDFANGSVIFKLEKGRCIGIKQDVHWRPSPPKRGGY